MNILVMALYLGEGGVSRYIQELSNYLSKKQNKIAVVCVGSHKNSLQKDDHLELSSLPPFRKNFILRFMDIIEYALIIKKIIINNKIEILISNTPVSNLWCQIIKFTIPGSNLRILRVVHGRWSLEVDQYPESRNIYGSQIITKLLPAVAKRLEKTELIRSDFIIAVSKEIMEYVKSLGVTRQVHIIPAGVDEAKFVPAYDKKAARGFIQKMTIQLSYLLGSSKR